MSTIPADLAALSRDLVEHATHRQQDVLAQLTCEGWLLRAWHTSHHDDLLVDGRTNLGEPFAGAICVNGNLTGHELNEPPEWLERLEDLGFLGGGCAHRMTDREHQLQRDRVRASVERDAPDDRPARCSRPAVRTRVSAPVLDGLEALFSL